jgi:type IV pilus assembly protein PilM
MKAGFHFKRSKSLLGLDIGVSSIQLVELTLKRGELALTGVDSAPTGGDPQRTLELLLGRGEYATRRVALAVGGRSVCVRHTRLPKMPRVELLEAIRLDSDRLLPFEDSAVTLDCQGLDAGTGNAEGDAQSVIVAACRTEFVEERVGAVQAAGFTPSVVDVDLFALVNAWCLDSNADRPEVVALVDVGAAHTGVVLVEGETPRFTREFTQGSTDSTSLAGEAGAGTWSGGTEPGELDALAREIALSVDYAEHNEGLVVEEIRLTGGGALVDGLASKLAEEARRPVELWNPIAAVTADAERVSLGDLGERGPTFTVALGLAARVLCA